jgi:Rrf2 family protein
MRKDNVQFSIAVHLMTILGYMQGQVLVSHQLAASVNTSPSFIRRILSKLSKAGLVKATAGKKGSCILNREAKSITLLDIYKALGAPVVFTVHGYPNLNVCPVSCNIKPAMNKVVQRLQKSLEKALKGITLQDLVREIKEK